MDGQHLYPCCSSSPCSTARSLPCATRSDQRQTAGRRFTNPKSKTRPALRLRSSCLQHPGRCRSLDAGLSPANLDHMDYSRMYTCICRTLKPDYTVTFLFPPVTRSVHEARCPVKPKSTTCPETDEVRVSPLPKARAPEQTPVFQPPPPSTSLILTNRLLHPLRSHAPPCSLRTALRNAIQRLK